MLNYKGFIYNWEVRSSSDQFEDTVDLDCGDCAICPINDECLSLCEYT